MFGIGGVELVIIAIFGLLLFGPDKLPEIIRTVSGFVRDFKRYSSMMQSTFKAEMDAIEALAKDEPPKKTSAEFNKKVAGSTFTKPATPAKTVTAAKPAPAAADAQPTGEPASPEAPSSEKTAAAEAPATQTASPESGSAEASPATTGEEAQG